MGADNPEQAGGAEEAPAGSKEPAAVARAREAEQAIPAAEAEQPQHHESGEGTVRTC